MFKRMLLATALVLVICVIFLVGKRRASANTLQEESVAAVSVTRGFFATTFVDIEFKENNRIRSVDAEDCHLYTANGANNTVLVVTAVGKPAKQYTAPDTVHAVLVCGSVASFDSGFRTP